MNDTSQGRAEHDWGEPRSKTVTWYGALAGIPGVRSLSGREVLQAMADGRLPPPPIASLFQVRIVRVGDGEVTFRCRPHEYRIQSARSDPRRPAVHVA